jgi:hypothetical protein
MESVFCSKCKYLLYPDIDKTLTNCNHPSNRKLQKEKNWYSESNYYVYFHKPSEINRNNSCVNFEKKV